MQSQSWSLAGLECQQCVELCKDNKCAKFYQQLTFCFTIQGFCFLLLNSIYSLSPFPRFFLHFSLHPNLSSIHALPLSLSSHISLPLPRLPNTPASPALSCHRLTSSQCTTKHPALAIFHWSLRDNVLLEYGLTATPRSRLSSVSIILIIS